MIAGSANFIIIVVAAAITAAVAITSFFVLLVVLLSPNYIALVKSQFNFACSYW